MESEKRALWLAAGDLEPRTGGRVKLEFDHRALSLQPEEVPEKYSSGECFNVEGKVVEGNEPHLLRFTWGWGKNESKRESVVTFRRNEVSAGTLLAVTHERIELEGDVISISAGWHNHLGILEDRILQRTSKPFWETHRNLEAKYREMLGVHS